MLRKVFAILLSAGISVSASAQTVSDSGYRTIGHAKGIPVSWAAFYFFFRE